jgi:sugar O-acyltransferase (sialic acid O-acetyltransferase NeuD family)
MKHLIIIGARGFGRAVCDLACEMPEYQKEFDIKGYLDDKNDALVGYDNYPPIIGSVEAYAVQPDDVFVCALGDVRYKKHYSEIILDKGGHFMNVIHPSAHIGTNVKLGIGCIVAGNVWIDSDTQIGDFVTLQVGALIGHDCQIDNWSIIDSACFLGGFVHLEESVTVHPHSSIIPHLTIHKDAIVNIASTVIREVKENTTVMGNPAREIIMPKQN